LSPGASCARRDDTSAPQRGSGAPSTTAFTRASISELWQSDDLAARELRERDWRRLLACDDPALALRQAKLAQLADTRRRHGDAMPGTWAAFLLDGP
jgi:CHAT domain-containing protein